MGHIVNLYKDLCSDDFVCVVYLSTPYGFGLMRWKEGFEKYRFCHGNWTLADLGWIYGNLWFSVQWFGK